MANSATTKTARRAAREAAVAAQEELARRTRANVVFIGARAQATDEWLRERTEALREQAAPQRPQCGAALRSTRDRGESLREIAKMAGIPEKSVHQLIKTAEPSAASPAAVEGNGASGGPAWPAQAEEARAGGEVAMPWPPPGNSAEAPTVTATPATAP